MPKVSIIVPVYNAAPYLPATIASILAQTFRDFELIAVDDGSEDGSPEWLAAQSDPRIRLVRLDPSGGPARPRNEGIRRSAAPYVALFDSDDLMQPDKIERQLALYERAPELGLVCTDFVRFRDGEPDPGHRFLSDYPVFRACRRDPVIENGYRIPAAEAYRALLFENYVGTSSVMLRREVWERVGGFDEALRNSDDRDLWFRICRECDIGYLDAIGHRYRVRRGSVSSRGPEAFEHRYEVFRRQLAMPDLTPEMLRQIHRRMAQYRFAAGYELHRRGQPARARTAYRDSLRHAFAATTLVALMKTWLPATWYRPPAA